MARNNGKGKKDLVQEVLIDNPDFLRQMVETVMQEILETEMTEHIGAAPYERSAGRKGHRNGYKPRMLRTRVGTLNLLVPQDREGNFSSALFGRYQRSEKALLLSLMEMYLKGDSYDNALTETIIGLFKTELNRNRGPRKGLDDVEFATLEWIDWFSQRRISDRKSLSYPNNRASGKPGGGSSGLLQS